MANLLYPGFKNALLSPGVNLLTANVKAVLVSNGSSATSFPYTSTDDFFSQIPSGAILAPPVALAGKVVTASGLQASPAVFPAVQPNGSQTGDALVLFIDTGVSGTSRLICWQNTQAGLPIVPNGSNITINWPSYIFVLT